MNAVTFEILLPIHCFQALRKLSGNEATEQCFIPFSRFAVKSSQDVINH
jgi:hypothetical protein